MKAGTFSDGPDRVRLTARSLIALAFVTALAGLILAALMTTADHRLISLASGSGSATLFTAVAFVGWKGAKTPSLAPPIEKEASGGVIPAPVLWIDEPSYIRLPRRRERKVEHDSGPD